MAEATETYLHQLARWAKGAFVTLLLVMGALTLLSAMLIWGVEAAFPLHFAVAGGLMLVAGIVVNSADVPHPASARPRRPLIDDDDL